MSINEHAAVDQLVEQGHYAEAAALASASGDHTRAADLYERIWDFAAAAGAAQRAGELARALRCAIEAQDGGLVDGIAEELTAQGEAGQRTAMEVFASRRRFSQAAELAESLGELERAADYFQRGHLDLDAARVLVALDRDRDAGRLLERAIQNQDPGPERAAANLALGKILARLIQHENAVRCLQDAAADPLTRDEARSALVVELSALGLRDAAREVHKALRTDHPDLTQDLDRFIQEMRPQLTPSSSSRLRVIGGRYRLEKLIGSGGSGRVYRATDEVSDKTVAVKLLSSTRSKGDQAYERFTREARVTTALRHPNLVEVFDVFPDLGFLVMEFMVGGSLDSKIRRERLEPAAVRRLGLEILAGLELAHQRGIIHRDVKPANIFFDARGTAKLGDFGVAHLLDLGQTQTGGLIGSLAYMSPEQITGAPLSITADLYGLGISMFEALTGRLPFLGPDFVAQHLGEAAPKPSQIQDVDRSWDPIIDKLLAKSPSERYESIQALRRDLTALDVGESAGPLILPKGGSVLAPRERKTTIPVPVSTPESSEDREAPRYSFESPLGTTERSTLSRSLDTVLNRSVIIERFHDPLPEEDERRLYALARGGGPFLQRALSYDRNARIAIFEAPAGAPIEELKDSISTRLAVRLFRRLARAVGVLHLYDRAHGAIDTRTVLLDDRGHPTVLVCGLPALAAVEPRAQDDVEALIRVVARTLHATPTAEGLVARFLPAASPEERRVLLAMPRENGEELHAFADAIELLLLQRKQAGGDSVHSA